MRKGDQFREGSAASLPDSEDTCPNVTGLLCMWRAINKPPEKMSYILPAFSFAAAKRGDGRLAFDSPVGADTYRKVLALWFVEALSLDVGTFQKKIGMKSGHAGGATSAFRAGAPVEAV